MPKTIRNMRMRSPGDIVYLVPKHFKFYLIFKIIKSRTFFQISIIINRKQILNFQLFYYYLREINLL